MELQCSTTYTLLIKSVFSFSDVDIPVVAMETQGAHAFNAALKAGKPVSIGDITR